MRRSRWDWNGCGAMLEIDRIAENVAFGSTGHKKVSTSDSRIRRTAILHLPTFDCTAPRGKAESQIMTVILTFLLGMGNFALHRAVLESGHPMVREMPAGGLRKARYASLALEFVLLCGALYAAERGYLAWLLAYLGYSLFNGFAAWLLIKGRL